MAERLGIDVGSTTVKVSVLGSGGEILYSSYVRHYSRVKECLLGELEKVRPLSSAFRVCVTGSAGLGLAERGKLPFVQEVQAAYGAVKKYYPQADVAVELGGEDAKIVFLTGGAEQRMNGSCAGGTGAFIDQMATLLDLSVQEMDELSLQAEKIYPIASRCGVFAKSDIQPLLNQGARKADIAASIFRAVVDQTVAGLAQGRRIKGTVLFLGGPLYFLKGLRKAFCETLGLDGAHAVFPENAPCFMSVGAALAADSREMTLDEIEDRVKASGGGEIATGEPLFSSREEYDEFIARHLRSDLQFENVYRYKGDAYLGVDSGSTTTKLILITPDCKILYSHYQTNNGQPLEIVADRLREIYSLIGDRINIRAACVTGYGEEMMKAALKMDFGVVETMAHFKAALYFNPDVDFIIDIGGQDIKCFKVKNGAIDSIMLNEACSSGCGSFIQTFAKAMGMEIEPFSRLGLFAKHPVELGSRCTVFMNSSVKQAQKEGASVEDISAGLSASIVKNAIYKVIRARTPEELGKHIVVQGGTFLNDAVLRSFEKETGREVVRPAIAGLMGAFGAALYARENAEKITSDLITEAELAVFRYSARSVTCGGCTSKCSVNILTFSDGRRYISGNKCERGAGLKPRKDVPDLYARKYEKLLALPAPPREGARGTVGLPLQLLMYEQLPLWTEFFEQCGFNVVLSEKSSRALYFKGQHTVASDTACYPAKLMHGHIESLLDKGVDFIFYPCESYNFDEHDSENHFNCPVVAYYPELLRANNERLTKENFLAPYLDPNSEGTAVRALRRALGRYRLPLSLVRRAFRAGLKRMETFRAEIVQLGKTILEEAEREGKQVIVLAGRPYHADPEINHGIDKLLTSLGISVLSEDAVFAEGDPVKVNVLNQWTYHARLYRAAEFATRHENVDLVQLVSFGCGIDAITTDEVRAILESRGKLYTQIKIDEITGLGVVKIRLRSLLAALEEKKRKAEREEGV